MEPGDEEAARALVHGNPRGCEKFEETTGNVSPARLPQVPLPPGNRKPHYSPEHRRGYRAGTYLDVPASQGAPGRGDRDRVAEDPEGDLREEKHFRAGIDGRFG